MKENKSDFFLYNILNFENKNVVFLYGLLLVIFIFIFTHINVTFSLFIGLIFYTIIIYYFYTDRNLNFIYKNQQQKDKFESINTKNLKLEKYDNIVDLIYFCYEFKKHNLDEFNQIISLFEQFSNLYDSCIKDYSLIDNLFDTMIYIKYKIVYKINSFIFNTDSAQYKTKINNFKENTIKVLNEYLDKLILIQKKKIYYNGYNINTKIINTDSVLPHNFNSDTNPYTKLLNSKPDINYLLGY
jgi:hypothetical protein